MNSRRKLLSKDAAYGQVYGSGYQWIQANWQMVNRTGLALEVLSLASTIVDMGNLAVDCKAN